MAISWKNRLVINVVAPKITKVIRMSAAMGGFNTSVQEVVAVVHTHTTVTHMFAVVVKSIERGAAPVVVMTEFITLRFQCAA
jgi:hypothetical protein